MDKKKLNAKDFINIGIFTVIYFVMFFITGMLGTSLSLQLSFHLYWEYWAASRSCCS